MVAIKTSKGMILDETWQCCGWGNCNILFISLLCIEKKLERALDYTENKIILGETRTAKHKGRRGCSFFCCVKLTSSKTELQRFMHPVT